MTLSGLSTLGEHAGYIVQSTPSEPDFWMGNQIIVQDASISVAEALALFVTHFPEAEHRAVVWDIPDLASDVFAKEAAKLGLPFDGFDALSLKGPLRDVPVPDGIVLRALDRPEDWAKAQALQAEIGIEEGRDPLAHGPYLERRNAARRVQIAKGIGQWFGAFAGDDLVAQMGIFHDAQIARYQSVETRANHRRRGICSALLRHVAQWALDRAPQATVVIVAEADSNAGRLYRRMGFSPTETLYGVVGDGY